MVRSARRWLLPATDGSAPPPEPRELPAGQSGTAERKKDTQDDGSV